MVFDQEGRRRVCTPYLDTTAYGNLRFHFTMGTRLGVVPYIGRICKCLQVWKISVNFFDFQVLSK